MSSAEHIRVGQLLDLNRAAEAQDLAEQHLAQTPNDAHMLSLLADAQLALAGPKEALARIDQALALEHNAARFHAQRGLYLSKLSRHEQADESFVTALSLEPTNMFALSAHVEAILRDPRTARKKYKTERLLVARQRADALLSTYPDAAISHLMDAKVKLVNKDFRGCDQAASTALRIDPNNSVGHQLVGLAAEGLGETRKAGDAYVSAQKADPTSSTGLEGLRRVSSGVATPLGIGGFFILRAAVRAGRLADGVAAVLIIGAVVGALMLLYVKRQDRANASVESKLSPQAQAILEQDRKLR